LETVASPDTLPV